MAWWAIFVQRITAKWQSFDSDRWCCRIPANWCTPLQALQSSLVARCNINSTAKQLHKRYSLAVNPLQSAARFVRGDFICLKYTKSILQITQMAEVCTCCILMLSLRIRPLHIGHLWSSPPRETSVIWALKFHTDDVVLTKIRSNESDWSIYLTPRINSKAKRKARRRKAKSCLEIFFKSVSMMFVASFKLSPLEKSSFGLYTVAKSRNAQMLQCQKLKAGILKPGSTKIKHRTDKGWSVSRLIQSVLLWSMCSLYSSQKGSDRLHHFSLSDFLDQCMFSLSYS